jgi:hypothetical protein
LPSILPMIMAILSRLSGNNARPRHSCQIIPDACSSKSLFGDYISAEDLQLCIRR